MNTEELRTYMSIGRGDDNNITLVSHVKGVITCENYCKWYNLFYIDEDGTVSIISNTEEFFDEVEMCDHSFEPLSLVEFAINHSYKIGSESYRAICYMYAEYCEYDKCIPDEHLPSVEQLNSVLVEDHGNWSNCFPYTVFYKGFKLSKDGFSKPSTICRRTTNIGGIILDEVNEYMYAVIMNGFTGHAYLIDNLNRIGEAVEIFVHESVGDDLWDWDANHMCEELPDRELVTKPETIKEENVEENNDCAYKIVSSELRNVDLDKIPAFIDQYTNLGGFVDGCVVSFPRTVCRGQCDKINNKYIPKDVHDKAMDALFERIEEGYPVYVTISNFPQHNTVILADKCFVKLDEIIGNVVGVDSEHVYVKITSQYLLASYFLESTRNKVDMKYVSVGMRYIAETEKGMCVDESANDIDNHSHVQVVRSIEHIICFDLYRRPAGNIEL